MQSLNEISKEVSLSLLKIEAIKLQPLQPFTWASGWKSPIYCDNRKTLSYPVIRTFIKQRFTEIIREKYPKVDVIAGVATGAIAIGALVAEEMGLPFVYVRSSAKGHGLENLIEGNIVEGQSVVVIEDLISTGGSSLKAVDALRKANCDVMGMIAIFTYGFSAAIDNFQKSACELLTLSDYNALIELALETGYINQDQIETLKNWRKAPDQWQG